MRRSEHSKIASRAAKAAVVGVVLFSTLVGIDAPASAEPCVDVFPASFRQTVASEFPGRRVTAAVFDTRTGCWHHLNQGMRIQTASVIKAQFLAGTLLRAQDAGRGLSSYERGRIVPMISLSFNQPASDLFVSLGSVSGMNGIDRRFGLTSTSHTTKWGATVSTAEDRTKLALALLHGGGPLNASSRATAWSYMGSVHGSQQWGITAGVPDGWSVALKNGFYPTTGAPAWRIGSTGFVRDDLTGEGYAVTVQTDQNPDHVTGQRLTERVAEQISTVLTSADTGARLVDRSRCVTAGSGASWSSLAAQIGTGNVGGVQFASGGTPNPLRGMRACAPDFSAAPPRDPRSTVNGVYDPFVGDFDGDGSTDVFWYRPGTGLDHVWSGGGPGSEGVFATRSVSVSGTFEPLVGDFDGDGIDDVFWYRPGPWADYVWTGSTGRRFESRALSVGGIYEPLVGDFDGDGIDDIFWYRPGSGLDFVWSGSSSGRFDTRKYDVRGFYEPFVGRFDDGASDDIFWYRPGSGLDYVWTGRPDRTFLSTPFTVAGNFSTAVGDLTGDGRDDIFWNASGGGDRLWTASGTSRPSFASSTIDVPGFQRPVVGDLDGDPEVEVLFYGPGREADLLFDGGPGAISRPVNGRYLPVSGDFDADGRGDILFYGRGGAVDSMFLGTDASDGSRLVQPRGR